MGTEGSLNLKLNRGFKMEEEFEGRTSWKAAIQMAKYLTDTKRESITSIYKGKWCADLLITEANSGIHFHAK